MKFDPIFVSWILLLHHGAKPRLLLSFISDIINVDFSVRQGDPIAMLLFILYIEPMLLCLQDVVSGFALVAPLRGQSPRRLVQGAVEKLEGFVDDTTVIVTNDQEFLNVNDIIARFERLSGAILNRDTKSKVMGLGRWRNREGWPLPWLSTVDKVKVFGFILHPCYQTMLKLNWEHQLSKFTTTPFSWETGCWILFLKGWRW